MGDEVVVVEDEVVVVGDEVVGDEVVGEEAGCRGPFRSLLCERLRA